jgi:hypothetical protein
MMSKARTNQDLGEIEYFPKEGEVQRDLWKEAGFGPKVHWRIADERKRREHNLAGYNIELSRQTKTWEGFAAWLLQLREHLETTSKWHMMRAWPEPNDWPEIALDDLSRHMGPYPDNKYWADRKWIRQRFLQLQRWGQGKIKKGYELQWYKVGDQLWFLDPQREGEALIKDILETKASWMQQAQQAWDDFDVGEEWPTEKNRFEAVRLLDEVFWTETYPEMFYGPLYWHRARQERQSQYQKLAKMHRKVDSAVQHVTNNLRKYHTTVWQASLKPRPATGYSFSWMFPPGRADREGIEIENAVAGLSSVLGEAETKLSEVKKILEMCVSAVTMQQKSPRGRREKRALNTAIVEMDKKYKLLTDRQTIQRIHTLLYIAGIWPKDDYQSLTAKFYQLRNNHAAEPL